MTGRVVDRRKDLLPGTAVVAFLMATSRWGSYVGVPPLFLTDVLILLAFFHAAVSRAVTRSAGCSVLRPMRAPKIVLVLIAYVLFRLLASPTLSAVALRDAAPYLYCIVVLLVFFAPMSEGGERRTDALLYGALALHSFWVLLSVLNPGLAMRTPTLGEAGVHILELRSDHDAALLGLAGALALRRVLIGVRPHLHSSYFVACLAALMLLQSRAGVVAGLASVALVTLVTIRQDGSLAIRGALLLAAPLILAAAFFVFPQTDAGARLGLADSTSAASGAGTANARQAAWGGVIAYTTADKSRLLFGVGFGPDFLSDSGASVYLEGTTFRGVRSPHNFLVGSLARLGLIGVSLLVMLLFLPIREVMRAVTGRRRLSQLQCLAAGLIVATAVTASFGVILESPFAAVPFYFATGVLLRSRGVVAERTGIKAPMVLRTGPQRASVSV